MACRCINKDTDKNGKTNLYLMQDDSGKTEVWNREQVVVTLQNSPNFIKNLKLTSDGKIINREEKAETQISKANVYAYMLFKAHKDTDWCKKLGEEITNAALLGKDNLNKTLEKWVKQIEGEIKTSGYLNMQTDDRSEIEILSYFTSGNAEYSGYYIKNIGNYPIKYLKGKYSFSGKLDTIMWIARNLGEDVINPGEEKIVTFMDFNRIMSNPNYAGECKNSKLRLGHINFYISTPTDLLRIFNMDMLNIKGNNDIKQWFELTKSIKYESDKDSEKYALYDENGNKKKKRKTIWDKLFPY